MSAILVFAWVAFVWLTYEIMFDPDAVNITSRLTLLSIDPDKWA